MTARDNLRKRSRTIGMTSSVLTVFFFFFRVELPPVSSPLFTQNRSCENETHRYRYLRYRNAKRTHRGNASFKLTLLVIWLEFYGQYIRTAYKWMNTCRCITALSATEETMESNKCDAEEIPCLYDRRCKFCKRSVAARNEFTYARFKVLHNRKIAQ